MLDKAQECQNILGLFGHDHFMICLVLSSIGSNPFSDRLKLRKSTELKNSLVFLGLIWKILYSSSRCSFSVWELVRVSSA